MNEYIGDKIPFLNDLGLAIKNPSRALRYVFVKMPVFAKRYVPLDEIFIKQEYNWLYKRIKPNTTIIDIGAYIGDSSIYFSFNQNVSKIFAYELVYKNYKEAEANFKRLGLLGSKVTLTNAGVDGYDGSIDTDEKHGFDSGARIEKMPKGSHKTQICSLKSILKDKNNVIIKADAEGAEHRMFEDADLSEVYAIQMEYHDGLKNLVAVLEKKGFKVSTEEKAERAGEGYLYAEKINSKSTRS